MHKFYILYKRQKVKKILWKKTMKLSPNLSTLDKESHDIGEPGILFNVETPVAKAE